MGRSGFALVAALLPLAGTAADLTLDVTGAVDYDTNVFRRDRQGTSRDIDDDVLFRLRPGVEIHEDRGQDFNYSAKYQLPVEFAAMHSSLDDIDHVADGRVSYHPSDRLNIYANDRFRYLRSTLVNRVLFDPAAATVTVDSGRDRVSINAANLGAQYLVGPRLSLGMEAGHDYFRTSRPDRQDNDAVSASLNSFYSVNSRHQAGLGVSYRWQAFEKSTRVVKSDSQSANVFLQWRWQIDETMGLDLAVGPSLIRTRQDTQPEITHPTIPTLVLVPFVPTQRDLSVNVFAQAGVIKRWTPTLRTGARYTRSQGTASGIGGSVIADTVVATLDLTLRERWEISLRGDYGRQRSVTKVTRRVQNLSSKLESNRWGATVKLDHRLFRKTRVFGQVVYNNQSSDSSLSSSSDFENWIFSIGLHHSFEPIKLW